MPYESDTKTMIDQVEMNNEGAKFAALLLKIFMYVKRSSSDSDAIYYLVKGLEMIHHELYKEYVKERESDPDTYEGKHYEKKYQCRKLSEAIEALEVE
jgi:hypothetical protein